MKKTIFTGAGVAIVTPMNDDFTVNYDVFGKLIDFQIENQTDALIVCGTTGESSTLTHEEHCQVIEYAIRRANGRVPVIAGTGSNDTAYALELSKEAEKMGADGLLMVTPYYNKTSQKGLVAHYTYIADRVNTPIILYNVPSRTGVDIKPETYAQLCGHENIVAIKEANGNVAALAKTLSLCDGKLDVYSGNDDQVTSFMALGAKGVISVLSNVAPRDTHDMATACLKGDYPQSAALQIGYMDLIHLLFSDVNPIPVKAAVSMLGFPCGECRMPLAPADESLKTQLMECMKKHNLV